ncbi:MAG: hypothetical protein KIT09_04090 [Bryobacteraceae bacterium]|nr:hypothetical protein [Bryobacteraceae bacterium]
MGVSFSRPLVLTSLIAVLAGTAFAAPKLRLSTAAVGPVSVAVGANGPRQVVEAYNAGDGSLTLRVAAADSWLVPAVGGAAPCTTRAGSCFPINIELQTASLSLGLHTGTVIVTAADALDAPQTITVTVQPGGGVPAKADLFVAPNGSADSVRFATNSELRSAVTTQSGGRWLSFGIDGFGSFRFVWPYLLEARHLPGLAEGSYSGSVNITGSSFQPDNKNVPVTLRVTSDPIAALSPDRVQIRVAQNTIKPQAAVVVANRGLGALSITGAEVSTTSGGEWLAAVRAETGNIVNVNIDTANLAPGKYQGAVEIASNAVNGPLRVPVDVEVVAQGVPAASAGGVVNNAIYEPGDTIGAGGIASVFGEQFSFQDAAGAPATPLPTELGGVRVLVNGLAAPLYYASYGQINFQVPYEVQPGEARVSMTRDGQAGNTVTVNVARRAPRLLRLGIDDYGIIVNQDGTLPIPPTPGIPSRRARSGDALVIYATGFGQTNPPVTSGAAAPAAEPFARIDPVPTVYFGGNVTGGSPATPFFAGLTPGFVGLYQINVFVPSVLPRGDTVPLRVEGPGYVSNTIVIAIE